jgi:hypothetical protein
MFAMNDCENGNDGWTSRGYHDLPSMSAFFWEESESMSDGGSRFLTSSEFAVRKSRVLAEVLGDGRSTRLMNPLAAGPTLESNMLMRSDGDLTVYDLEKVSLLLHRHRCIGVPEVTDFSPIMGDMSLQSMALMAQKPSVVLNRMMTSSDYPSPMEVALLEFWAMSFRAVGIEPLFRGDPVPDAHDAPMLDATMYSLNKVDAVTGVFTWPVALTACGPASPRALVSVAFCAPEMTNPRIPKLWKDRMEAIDGKSWFDLTYSYANTIKCGFSRKLVDSTTGRQAGPMCTLNVTAERCPNRDAGTYFTPYRKGVMVASRLFNESLPERGLRSRILIVADVKTTYVQRQCTVGRDVYLIVVNVNNMEMATLILNSLMCNPNYPMDGTAITVDLTKLFTERASNRADGRAAVNFLDQFFKCCLNPIGRRCVYQIVLRPDVDCCALSKLFAKMRHDGHQRPPRVWLPDVNTGLSPTIWLFVESFLEYGAPGHVPNSFCLVRQAVLERLRVIEDVIFAGAIDRRRNTLSRSFCAGFLVGANYIFRSIEVSYLADTSTLPTVQYVLDGMQWQG